MQADKIDSSFSKKIKMPDGNYMLVVVGDKDQFSDLYDNVTKKESTGRNGKYKNFISQLNKALSED